jgi:hypothetical protein
MSIRAPFFMHLPANSRCIDPFIAAADRTASPFQNNPG